VPAMSEWRRRAAGLLAAVLVSTLAACGGEPPPPDLPNVVFVTLDTTRADHLGLYGYRRNTSPELDAFSRETIVFDRVLAPMATTLPSHLSLFTATHPLEHGVLANAHQGGRRFVLAPGLRTLAEVARDAGYRTAAFVSSAPLKRNSGAENGFDTYEQPQGSRLARHGHLTTNDALAWLSDTPRGPFLLWVHYFDAHWPFTPPRSTAVLFRTDAAAEAWLSERRVPERADRTGIGMEDSREVLNLYDAELRFQDQQLGRLLAALRARPDWPHTAVVIVGDHGEGLSQHGHPAHGGTWNEQLRVPLLMRIPGQTPRRESQLLSVEDVLPTLLGLMRVPELEGILDQASGRDRLADDAEWQVLSQDSGRFRADPGYRYALTTPRWKYFRIEDSEAPTREELYDLEADPFELTDVAAERPEVLAQMRERLATELAARLARGRELRPDEPAESPPDPGLLEQLRELGYLIEDDEAAPPGA
jgi:arylsulfatase A-like enzyme